MAEIIEGCVKIALALFIGYITIVYLVRQGISTSERIDSIEKKLDELLEAKRGDKKD